MQALSKSELLAFIRCPRELWLLRNEPTAAGERDESADRRAKDGVIVGSKARSVMLDNPIWPPGNSDKLVAMEQALKLIEESPARAAVEVTVCTQDAFARLDILRPADSPHVYDLVEVKASSFPLARNKVDPGKPDPWHVADLAIQRYITQEATDLNLGENVLLLLDNQWPYDGSGDYRKLFREMCVDKEVQAGLKAMPQVIAQAKETLRGVIPIAETGKQCKDPHECVFIKHCKKLDPPRPANPVTLLPGVDGKRYARELQEAGFQDLLTVPREMLSSNPVWTRIYDAHKSGKAVFDRAEAAKLASHPYPRYFLDYEGIDMPVPVWKGVRAYEQVTYEFSLHIEHAPGVFTHHAYLDISGEDPTIGCILKMKEWLGNEGPVFVYFETYEKTRMKEMARRHPEHADFLESIIDRLEDLLPVVKNSYYHPKMEGSFSIKKVLPCIAPHINYKDLTDVQDGTASQVAYMKLAFEGGMSPDERRELARNALLYCDTDTWGMVEIFHIFAYGSSPFANRPESDMSPMAVFGPKSERETKDTSGMFMI